jgi:hypothetical protein
MPALVKRSRTGTLAGLGLLAIAAAAITGFIAGLSARTDQSAVARGGAVAVALSAADTVSLRFPDELEETASGMSTTSALAAADAGVSLFDPVPFYPLSSDNTGSIAIEQPSANGQAPAAVAAKTAAAARPTRSNAVLNEAQLASIKRRLNLTRDQERYWPRIEAELRKLEYKKDANAGKGAHAAVDTSKVNVEGLKSVGVPLVMSFNDDQRQELKSLAHLLGLENVMSNF